MQELQGRASSPDFLLPFPSALLSPRTENEQIPGEYFLFINPHFLKMCFLKFCKD